jgi:hypothetical protein
MSKKRHWSECTPVTEEAIRESTEPEFTAAEVFDTLKPLCGVRALDCVPIPKRHPTLRVVTVKAYFRVENEKVYHASNGPLVWKCKFLVEKKFLDILSYTNPRFNIELGSKTHQPRWKELDVTVSDLERDVSVEEIHGDSEDRIRAFHLGWGEHPKAPV